MSKKIIARKITKEEKKLIRKHLAYDAKTGIITWIKKTSNQSRVKVGDEAGYLNTGHGYRSIKFKDRQYQGHRLAFVLMYEKIPEEVDHINHNKTDNRWANLRPATHKINGQNQSMKVNNKSGFTGVCWDKTKSKWVSNITVKGKQKNLGVFDDLQDAINCRKEANIKYGYHKNHGG